MLNESRKMAMHTTGAIAIHPKATVIRAGQEYDNIARSWLQNLSIRIETF